MIRPLKVIANALSAGFHLFAHRALPRPIGSSDRVIRYRASGQLCSVGKCPRARIVRLGTVRTRSHSHRRSGRRLFGASGQIRPATRKTLRSRVTGNCPDGDAGFALEGCCTGWQYVSKELAAAGVSLMPSKIGPPAQIRHRRRLYGTVTAPASGSLDRR